MRFNWPFLRASPKTAVVLAAAINLAACSPKDGPGVDDEPAADGVDEAPVSAARRDDGLITAPGLENRALLAPLADAWSRIDPAKDGWESEAFSQAASARLKDLAKTLEHPMDMDAGVFARIAAHGFACVALRPGNLEDRYRSGVFDVRRAEAGTFGGPVGDDLAGAMRHLLGVFDPESAVQAELKLYRLEPSSDKVEASVLVHLAGTAGDGGRLQINSEWITSWTPDADDPKLLGIEVKSYEQVARIAADGQPLFADATASVLGGASAYRDQLLRSTDHWRARIARDFGLDVVANHGMALGDVNGDGLDDLYVCQQGGLPNRLFIQEQSGVLRDITAESGTGWLDYCASALILDFDNDGDRDLVVSQDFKILFMDNLGGAKFELALGLGTDAQTFSLTAADYDLDGDLDLFLCGYNPAPDRGESGAMGEPMPYHDARNGGRNMLLRNDGGWEFTKVTGMVGLDENNNRFSFAASWEDYDDDGDPDLYVANDYGRNNLYQNEGGKFRDVAGELGVQDMSAGMSVNWADHNRDGVLDLYVSNMFSAAGNRITYQRQFQPGADARTRATYQRHARGNSLFQGVPGGGAFRDVSEAAGITMGRWAWGSRFADLDNDGWQDLVVANGFISTPSDTGDL